MIKNLMVTNPIDPYWNNVSLLLKGENAHGSQVFTDHSKNNYSITAVGNAINSTTYKKYGNSSIYLDGSGDYLTIPNAAVNFGTADFTFECWVYSLKQANSSGNFWVLLNSEYLDSGLGWTIGVITYQQVAGLHFGYGVYWNFITTQYTQNYLGSNVWQHIAVVRTGTTIKIFVDGVSQTLYTYEDHTTWNGGTDFTNNTATRNIGSSAPLSSIGDFYGYIDDLRITKGIARYNNNFTPPTAGFPTN